MRYRAPGSGFEYWIGEFEFLVVAEAGLRALPLAAPHIRVYGLQVFYNEHVAWAALQDYLLQGSIQQLPK